MLTQANYLQNDYNTLAYTTAVKEPRGASTIVHWRASGRNADGQINSMTIGGIHTTKTYDSLGRVKTIATGTGPDKQRTFERMSMSMGLGVNAAPINITWFAGAGHFEIDEQFTNGQWQINEFRHFIGTPEGTVGSRRRRRLSQRCDARLPTKAQSRELHIAGARWA